MQVYELKLHQKYLNLILSIISGIILGLSQAYLLNWLVWVSFIPLFIAINNKKSKDVYLYSSVSGFVFGIVHFLWIPTTLQRYSGKFSFEGLLGVIILSLILALFYTMVFLIFNYIKMEENNKTRNIILNSLIISVLYYLAEFSNNLLFPGIIWNKVYLGCTLSTQPFFCQLSSVIGSLGLVLLIVFVNYLIAKFILTRNTKLLFVALSVFSINILYGHIVVEIGEDTEQKHTVALVCENVEAETKWTEHGDEIIRKMLGLIREVKKYNPSIIVWPESALPWTYIENDDILLAISDILKEINAQNIIGYLTTSPNDSTLVYNSAYLIDKNGEANGRYDKNILLDFLEKPFLSSDYANLIPMLTRSNYNNVIPGDNIELLSSQIGKAWVMICNESLIPFYFNRPNDDFDYLVNISNDAWLENTQNITQHFNISRLRAIENRKDLIINSNRGISGVVDKYGRIRVMSKSSQPDKIISFIQTNNKNTIFNKFPLFFPSIGFLFIVFFLVLRMLKKFFNNI